MCAPHRTLICEGQLQLSFNVDTLPTFLRIGQSCRIWYLRIHVQTSTAYFTVSRLRKPCRLLKSMQFSTSVNALYLRIYHMRWYFAIIQTTLPGCPRLQFSRPKNYHLSFRVDSPAGSHDVFPHIYRVSDDKQGCCASYVLCNLQRISPHCIYGITNMPVTFDESPISWNGCQSARFSSFGRTKIGHFSFIGADAANCNCFGGREGIWTPESY